MKRVIAVHDMSGFGRCSLGVVLPVLAAMGVRACPLETAYLSAHTAFAPSKRAQFLDLTGTMGPTLEHWDELGAGFDGFYSGFLGSAQQIGLLQDYLSAHARPGFLVLVDPVMGDNGAPYRTYTPEMCRHMASLAEHADVVTPNLTEAAILLGEAYDPAPSWDKARDWLCRLSLGGKRAVVITGLSTHRGRLGAGCLDRSGDCALLEAPLTPGHFSGSGDLFAAILLGKLLGGASLADATGAAVRFVAYAARYTLQVGDSPVEGVSFEPLLGLLAPREDIPSPDALGL